MEPPDTTTYFYLSSLGRGPGHGRSPVVSYTIPREDLDPYYENMDTFPTSQPVSSTGLPMPLTGSGRKKQRHKQRVASPGTVDLHQAYGTAASSMAYPPALTTPRKPKVYVRVVFLKIGEIDTLKEQFKAEVFVQARWREPALDHVTSVEDISWHSLWNPQIQLENAMDDPRVNVWHDLKISETGEAFVLEKRRVKAEFAENLELQNFPFDVQHLSVIITSRLSDASLELLEDDTELSSVNLLTFVDEQEWEVRDIVEMIPEVRTREFSAIKHKFPMITVRTYAFRRAGFFVWNVLAVMVLICSLSLCTFSVERTLPQNRLQLSFTLVLTGIAFKFVVNQALPKISYLTVLDKYILGSMLMMHIVSVWHAVITRFDHDKELADDMDAWAFVILVLAYGIYNIGFAVVMTVKVYMKRKAVTRMEAEYQTKVIQLLERDSSEKGRIIRKSKRLYNNSRVGITL